MDNFKKYILLKKTRRILLKEKYLTRLPQEFNFISPDFQTKFLTILI